MEARPLWYKIAFEWFEKTVLLNIAAQHMHRRYEGIICAIADFKRIDKVLLFHQPVHTIKIPLKQVVELICFLKQPFKLCPPVLYIKIQVI